METIALDETIVMEHSRWNMAGVNRLADEQTRPNTFFVVTGSISDRQVKRIVTTSLVEAFQ